MPRLMYFLALATTSRRFAEVRCSRAARPVAARSAIISATASTSLPASIQRRIAGSATSSRVQVRIAMSAASLAHGRPAAAPWTQSRIATNASASSRSL